MKKIKTEQIRHAHHLNSLSPENQSKNAKDFLDKVMYQVELHELYVVLASCHFKEGADFCPVMVKIKNEDIIRINAGKQFLL